MTEMVLTWSNVVVVAVACIAVFLAYYRVGKYKSENIALKMELDTQRKVNESLNAELSRVNKKIKTLKRGQLFTDSLQNEQENEHV